MEADGPIQAGHARPITGLSPQPRASHPLYTPLPCYKHIVTATERGGGEMHAAAPGLVVVVAAKANCPLP